VSSEAVYQHVKKEGWRDDKPANAAPIKRLDLAARAPKHKGIPDGEHPVANGRRYCKHCGQTSPEDVVKCLHCFEKFAA
jgi:hypothetical protein